MNTDSLNLSVNGEPFKPMNGKVDICGFDIPVAKGDEKKFVEYLTDRCEDDTKSEIAEDIFRLGCVYLYKEWIKIRSFGK